MIKIEVTRVNMRVVARETMTSGSQNVFRVQFIFGQSWEPLNKTAVFRSRGITVSTLLDSENCCDIPWEVLEKPSHTVEVGICGTDDLTVLPSVWVSIGRVLPGAVPGEFTEQPETNVLAQIMARTVPAGGEAGQVLAKQSNSDFDTVWTTPENAGGGTAGGYYTPNVYQNVPGEMTVSFTPSDPAMPSVSKKTITLPKGADGEPGYTPVKGVDYFDGAPGKDGATGQQGPKGDKGDKGDPGQQGPQGIQGTQGQKGDKGDNGSPGYTPVKGTDYYTEAEKQEIIQQITNNILDPLEALIDESGVLA